MSAKGFAQFGLFQDVTLDSLIELSQSLAAQVEKITRLQFDAGLESSREAMAATQALLEVKDAEGLSKWQETYFQPNLDRATDSARQQYALLIETRDIVADALKQSTTDATRKIQENIDRIAEGAPEGFAPLFDAIRKSLETQVSALDTMGKVADQLGEIASANLQVFQGAAAAPAAKSRAATRRKAA